MAQVLVVDDSSTVRNELESFLTENGLHVSTANDGLMGLEALRNDPAIKLVITDINMPNMDGLTMVEKIRDELGNSNVAVLVLTTDNDPALKKRGKAAGVKGWIVKPFNGANVINPIKKLVGV